MLISNEAIDTMLKSDHLSKLDIEKAYDHIN